MKFGKRRLPSGAIGYGFIVAGLSLYFANFMLPIAPPGEDFFISLGALAFLGGWIFLIAWLVNGLRTKGKLQHAFRVGIWLAGSAVLTVAAMYLWHGLSGQGLESVSWNTLVTLLAISIAFAVTGWHEWQRNSTSAKRENRDYDDWFGWIDGDGGGDFDMD